MNIDIFKTKAIEIEGGKYLKGEDGKITFHTTLKIIKDGDQLYLNIFGDKPLIVREKFSTAKEDIKVSPEILDLSRELHLMLRSIGAKDLSLNKIKKFVDSNYGELGGDIDEYFQRYFELLNKK